MTKLRIFGIISSVWNTKQTGIIRKIIPIIENIIGCLLLLLSIKNSNAENINIIIGLVVVIKKDDLKWYKEK